MPTYLRKKTSNTHMLQLKMYKMMIQKQNKEIHFIRTNGHVNNLINRTAEQNNMFNDLIRYRSSSYIHTSFAYMYT